MNTNNKLNKIVERNCKSNPVFDKNNIFISLNGSSISVFDRNLKDLGEEFILPVKSKNKQIYLKVFKNFLLCQTDKSLFAIDLLSKQIKTISENFKALYFITSFVQINDRLCGEIDIYPENELGLFEIDFKNLQIIKRLSLNQSPVFLIGSTNEVFFSDEKTIYCHDISLNSEKWRCSIGYIGDFYDTVWNKNKDGYILKGAIKADNLIICPVFNNKIVAINMNSGTISWQIEIESEFLPKLYYLNEEAIIHIVTSDYYEINIKSGEIVRMVELGGKLDEKQLLPGEIYVSESLIYMICPADSHFKAFVVFNRMTGNIEEIYPIYENSYSTPVVFDNKLLFRDEGDNLYVCDLVSDQL